MGALPARGRPGDNSILVGALEDGVKFPEPEIADQRVELAEQAGFNALDVTTAWEPGRTEPDPGELLVLSNVARATAKRNMQLLITSYAPRPRFAPVTEEEQQNYATFMATLARELPTVAQLRGLERAEPERLLAVPVRRGRKRHRRA